MQIVRRRRAAALLAVLSGAAVLLTACQPISIDSGPPSFSVVKPAATLTPPSSSSGFSGPTLTTPMTTPSTEPPVSPIPGLASLAKYLGEKYSDAAWYGDVTSLNPRKAGITVETRLEPASGSRAPAKSICQAVRGYQRSHGGAATITIRAKGGPLLKRVPSSKPC